jgi:MFS family permease
MGSATTTKPFFYGWWLVGACFFTLGTGVGMPYFGMPFFYDYFERPVTAGGFGWSRSSITLGLPLGTLLTVWVGPWLVPRFSPRHLILVGTALTAITLVGFGQMKGSLWLYWGWWIVYMVGNVFSSGLPHQIILARWFVRHRGIALSIAYLGISLIGAFSARFVVKPLTESFGFRPALQIMGALLLLTWPLVLLVMRDRPEEIGLQPDGEAPTDATTTVPSVGLSFRELLRLPSLWVMLLSGACLAGATGAVSQHLKLILKDSGFTEQSLLNVTYSQTLLYLLVISAFSRLGVGWLADRYRKQHVLTVTCIFLLTSLLLLFFLQPPQMPYAFALLFGIAMGGDFLLMALLAADYFPAASLPRALALLLPIMTVGQTWFPYFIAVLREMSGSYTIPLGAVLSLVILGRALLFFLPALSADQRKH